MEDKDLYSKEVAARVKLILTDSNISVNKLKDLFDMNQSTLNKQLKGDTPLPLDTLYKVIKTFPDISMEWLMRGDGTMKRGFVNQLVGRLSSCGDGDVFQSVNTSSNEEDLKKQITELKAEKERLLGIIEKLTGSKG